MPLYEYLCPENGRTVEVRHRMSDEVRNWGELCECAGLEAADTRPESPVERLMSAPVPLVSAAERTAPSRRSTTYLPPMIRPGWRLNVRK